MNGIEFLLGTNRVIGLLKKQCGSGFATLTKTIVNFNCFKNVSNGVANPVTLQVVAQNYVVQASQARS